MLNASISAHLGMPETTVSGASKAGVGQHGQDAPGRALGRRDSRECVSPVPITSALLRDGPQERIQETKRLDSKPSPDQTFWHPPEEIAAGVLYLTSPESAFVSGAELIIDGGIATL